MTVEYLCTLVYLVILLVYASEHVVYVAGHDYCTAECVWVPLWIAHGIWCTCMMLTWQCTHGFLCPVAVVGS